MTAEKAKILIADDDPQNLEVMLSYLEQQAYEILYAPNGKKAVAIAFSELPDLIILDWEMPIMNGIEAIGKLKNKPETREIPIVMATGVMTGTVDLKTALDAGANDFLKKPFEGVEFKARVENALRLANSQKEVKKQHKEIIALSIREQSLLKDNLDFKTRELSSATLIEFQKNELLTNLLEEVKRLDNLTNNLYAPEIRKITRQISSYINLDKSWSNFKRHFDEVHPEFFEKVKNGKELTNNETRICAYLKIGLGNKEIAALTNVESGSVRRALHRLKKKLELGQDEVLREFISAV
ncbi:response regulator [Roseivirga sp.]|uniref:response regulator n=1 Tax=Roseivirga sp. TaxID=1964215 RepID=UPI003B8C0926